MDSYWYIYQIEKNCSLRIVTVLSLHYRFEALGPPGAARVGDEWWERAA